jgi:hypothetical protein
MIDAIGIKFGCAGGLGLIKDLFDCNRFLPLGTSQSIEAQARRPGRAVRWEQH